MDHICSFDVWLDGNFVQKPKLAYVGGRCEQVHDVNLDYINKETLYKMYKLCGGTKLHVEFYFLYPGQLLDVGLKYIDGDVGISFLINVHRGLEKGTLYVVDLAIEPLMVTDKHGKILNQKETLLLTCTEEVCEEQDGDQDGGIAVPPTTEKQVVHESNEETEVYVPTFEETGPSEVPEETECAAAVEDVEFEAWAETFRAQFDEAEQHQTTEEHPTTEFEGQQHPTTEEPGDSSSEFDDSSNEDYTQPHIDDDIDSDAPSEQLEDIEGSSDDDIFVQRNVTKQDQVRKLKRMMKRSRRPMSKVLRCRIDPTANGILSEPDDDDDIANLDDNNEGTKYPLYTEGQSMKNRDLEVCMKFPNVQVFREALRDWVVRNGYQLDFVKNERERVTAKCMAEGCKWRIHASQVKKGPLFQIKTLKGEHTCAKVRVNKHANAKYIGKRLEQGIKDNPSIPIAKLQSTILRKVGVDIGIWKTKRAKKAAIEKIRGQDAEEYKLLWDYCETVRVANPGSKLLLKKVPDLEPPIFERMYFCIDAMKKGFLSGCRPLIGLDGCFLKTLHGGQLLAAVGRDGNDNLFPIALAVVPVENREMWTWFISSLLEDIGGVEEQKWTFISDRQKGLLETLKDLAPGCAHRFCVRHIYQNFRQKWPSTELKTLLWKAASSGNKNEFARHMVDIHTIDRDAAEWLMNIPSCHWARSHFTTSCKTDVLVNNLCESFNNMILQARERPIISMFEWIRRRLTTRIQTKKTAMEKYEGRICPHILMKINKFQRIARHCFPTWCGRDEFEVEHLMDSYVVKLADRTCTCGIFQLNGYPCAHAWACIAERRYNVEDYVEHWYKKDMYLRAYEYMIHAVPSKRDYINTSFAPLAAPIPKKKMGRPKTMRRKGADEPQRPSYRRGLTHTCQNCLQAGHNRGSCKNATHPNSKFYKGNCNAAPAAPSRAPTAPQASQSQTSLSQASQSQASLSQDSQSQTSQSQASLSQASQSQASLSQGSRQEPRVYQGRRNAALLGKQTAEVLDKMKRPFAPPKEASSNIEGATSTKPKRKTKLQISDVLQNIKENAKKKRMWKI